MQIPTDAYCVKNTNIFYPLFKIKNGQIYRYGIFYIEILYFWSVGVKLPFLGCLKHTFKLGCFVKIFLDSETNCSIKVQKCDFIQIQQMFQMLRIRSFLDQLFRSQTLVRIKWNDPIFTISGMKMSMYVFCCLKLS